MNTRSALAPALAIALALSGCAATLGDVRPFPAPDAASRGYAAAPAVQPAYAAPGARDGGGSIYASAGGGHRGMHLFQDNKARQVGDLLTIVLVENTRARTNATTSVSKDSGVDMAAPTIFGRGVTVNGRPVLQAGIEGSRDFSGAGDSAQSNQLAGNITVTVVEDLGNGNLRVAGEKRLRLNQGDELVQIQGLVRVADIGADNRITSDRVAEAAIVYGGRGTLARSNAMGWLGRFFNSAAYPY
ncbi:flagellar basal body L-ring protein FlgH [Luteimonas wenzhouensis]|uniref:Flagellar L-ring protein n=1 Tax=Luteimonas wenzhouensis TaxID=2599615 RepID=A0A5C5TXM6_9GAMM|nr:flagellar basal body L-ring protein FlgH [Luteimonas wenzhouensis]NLW97549.1 flagellar basal body L-ring protein FlgH [Xanthomonadaceae bacterium]TWT18042.1 flagellar basal body L-ring protein FlgH [Luteimonas wenzhouensis]